MRRFPAVAFAGCWAASAAAVSCDGAACAAVSRDEMEGVHLLQRTAGGHKRSGAAGPLTSPSGLCDVDQNVACPGAANGAMCMGDQCCPGTAASGGLSFSCPSATLGHTGCQTKWRGHNCVPCLCTFDVDRTLTGKQGDLTTCPHNVEFNITDTAYGGGSLSVSEVGQSFENTFCSGCYVAIVTAGDASGKDSKERDLLAKRLAKYGTLLSTEWVGPSVDGDHRRNCSGVEINSQLVVGCEDGTKQFAVEGIVGWLKKSHGVEVAAENVWHFDDRRNNIGPFEGTGFNARQISCDPRDGGLDGIGHCGARTDEIVAKPGVAMCP